MEISAYVFERLELFITSEHGWDGGGGKPTTRKHVKEALRMLQTIERAELPPPSLVMGASGDIALIYQTNRPDIYVSLETYAQGYYSAYVFEGDCDSQVGYFPFDTLPQFVIDGIRKART
jgi:hypothetical protein